MRPRAGRSVALASIANSRAREEERLITGGEAEIAHAGAQILLILDDENALAHAAAAAARTGSSMRNVEP